MRSADEHTKLARIALDFTPQLDDAFKINVAKMKVQIPQQIKDDVDAFIKPIVKKARDIYDKNDKDNKSGPKIKPSTSSATGIPFGKTGSIDNSGQTYLFSGSNTKSESTQTWTLQEIQSELEQIADDKERPVINRVFRRFADNLKN